MMIEVLIIVINKRYEKKEVSDDDDDDDTGKDCYDYEGMSNKFTVVQTSSLDPL